VRPLIKNPKVPNTLEVFNILSVLLSDYLVYVKMGPWALVWMLMSLYMGLRLKELNHFFSLHPLAGNLIAEHYEFLNRLETYDYLGVINYVNLNIGYHVEHHDFPQIPWTRLPIVRKMAPEFYDRYPFHSSYMRVFY
jgi:sphingolipid delta-4 desaturase